MSETFKSLFAAGPRAPDTWPWNIGSYKDLGVDLVEASDGYMTENFVPDGEYVWMEEAKYSSPTSWMDKNTGSSVSCASGKRSIATEGSHRARATFSVGLRGGITKSGATKHKVIKPEAGQVLRQMIGNGGYMDTSRYPRNSLNWTETAGLSSYDAPCERVLRHTYHMAKECIVKSKVEPSRQDKWAAEANIDTYHICMLLVREMYWEDHKFRVSTASCHPNILNSLSKGSLKYHIRH